MAGTEITFDERTTDPVLLAAMFNQVESGATAADPLVAATTTETTKVEPSAEEVAAKAAAEAAALAEKDPDGIATKDGKHIIPYSVLKADRDRATRAEQALREAQDKLAELEKAAKSATGVKEGEVAKPQQAADANDLSEEDLALLKEDFPTVYKGLMAMKAQASALEAKLKPVEDSVRSDEQARQQTAKDAVQEAIDANPKLAHIMATDKHGAELAKRFDNMLKADPDFADKSFTERFAEVVKLIEGRMGKEITLPGTTKPAKSAEEIKQEAMAVAKAAALTSKTHVPTSLSDFPAGQHAASDEQEAMSNMTPLQIAQKFGSMSPDKLEAYLQNL